MKKSIVFLILFTFLFTFIITGFAQVENDETPENTVTEYQDDTTSAEPQTADETPAEAPEETTDGAEDEYIPKTKLPTSAGIQALRSEFEFYQGPTVYGVRSNDYALFNPVGENDGNKYPLVIYLHGAFHGWFANTQIDDSDFPYWASEELQSRFTAGGAFIMMPRSVGAFTFWDGGQIASVKAAVDYVVSQFKDNIDTSKIVIMGSSDGGAMVRKMIIAYPDYFCGALTLCQMGFYTAAEAKITSKVPVWLIANKRDFFVLYPIFQVPMWNTVKSNTKVPGKCRFTSLDYLYYPDGSKPRNTHNLARVASYDLQMIDGSDYPYCHTVDGNGHKVDIHAGNGIIAWINTL